MLSIEDDDRDDLLNDILNICKNPILLEINEATIPPQLEWILIEVVVARYNQLNHEGYASESVEGGSITFNDDLLVKYEKYFKKYLENKSLNTVGIEFI